MFREKILRQRYALLEEVVEGAFCKTYLARDRDLPDNLLCIVKSFQPRSADERILAQAREIFERETQLLYRLGKYQFQIPNLCARFEENGQFYLVREYIEGENLSEEAPPGSCLSESETRFLLQEILEVLQILHQHNIIHQNLKPQNLIRCHEDRKIVLIDFGAIKEISLLGDNKNQNQLDYSAYLAPEQVEKQPKLSSDIYAVGIIGICALTGLTPQEIKDKINWRDRVRENSRLALILEKMIQENFCDRYPSAVAALQALITENLPIIFSTQANFIIEPRFEQVHRFVDGLAPVKIHDRWGYIDKTGNLVIPPEFVEAYRFAEGLAPVKQDKLYGFIDTNGNFVIPPQFEDAYWFNEEIARVKQGKMWGYIEKSGKFIIPPQFEDAYWFTEGLAPVKVGSRYGYINKNGDFAIAPQFLTPSWFSEGLVAVEAKKWLNVKLGYIEKSGKFVIPPQFDEAYRFANGLAPVKVGAKYGYIDKSGKFAIAPQFEDAYWFTDGIARVKDSDRWGYIDTQGNFIIQPEFAQAYWFSEGLAQVKQGNQWGYINLTGNLVISPQFADATPFSEGLAAVKVKDKWGFISLVN
ncbi:MAG: WG repeat-containing protein [Oscillatoria sp. PMC 1051.18]|nr:WG repeat-containing protein [Oscillatoria sp. PMC 1050.18]MEC5028360.1 WG repeat-containing protein [Oscillatoria sp. PMC 1051.18]